MMKVAIYQDELSPYREELFHEISRRGVESHMIVGGPPVNRPYWMKKGTFKESNLFKKIFLNSTRLNLSIYVEYFSPKILPLLLKEKYDIVVVPFGMVTGPLLLYTARRANSLTVSGTGVSFFSPNLARIVCEPIVRLGALLSDNFVAYSKYAREYLIRESANPSKIVVIPNGVNTEKFNPEVQPRDLRNRLKASEKKLVLFVGRLERKKGVDYLIRAMALVRNKVRNAHLLVIGNGSQEMFLKNLVHRLRLTDSVTFLGTVASEKMPEYYAVCDVHVAPSIVTKTFIEPFGMVYIEAMASGKPSIAFDIPAAVHEVIIDGKTGYLVPERNVEILAGRICELLHDDERRREMGRKARERVVEKYDMNVIAGQWTEAFRTFLDRSTEK